MTTVNTENTLFEKFQDFVAGMSADQEIQNEGEGGLNSWDNCAIGLFARSIGRDGEYLTTFAKEVCEGQPAELFNRLNTGNFHTYGELDKYIACL